MAYDEGLADLLRGALATLDGVAEKQMFGGLCFMVQGHMLCGVHKGGGMVRVGKDRQGDACALPGVTPMEMGGRRMGGVVNVTRDALAEDAIRGELLRLGRAFLAGLPPR